MKRVRKRLILYVLFLIGGILFLFFNYRGFCQPVSSADDRLTEVEVKQESLRSTTQRVKNQLSFIIEEFERNGIGGEDVQVLKSLQSILGQLSDNEMLRIIELLKEARILDDPSVSQNRMLEAFTGQKSIMIKLKQLLDEFKRQKELYELSIFFNRLAEKQNINLKEAIALEPILQGKTIDKLTEPQKVPLQVQATEQTAIKEETLLGISRLEKIAGQEFTKTTELAIKGLSIVTNSNLKNALSDAIEDLKMARLYSAIGNQKRVRDALREIARQLIPPVEIIEALRQAMREMENLIAEQKAVIKQTEDLKQNSRTLDNNKEIASRQLELSDRADSLRQALKDSAPSAAENLKESINKMHETHAILNANEGRWRAAEAIAKEKESLKSLEKARDELEKQVAALEGINEKPADPISRLKDLINRVENLVNQQSNLVKEAADVERNNQMPKRGRELAQKQSDLKRETQNVQADSSPISKKAAEALNNAAEQMARSEKSLERGKNDPFSQNYAVDSLKKAADELKRALGEKEKAMSELAGIDKALDKISDIIKDQQNLNRETAAAAASPQMPDPQRSMSLARKQGENASKSQNLQGEVSQLMPEASKALSQAKENMQQAENSLAKANPSNAMLPQTKALENLYNARNALENRAAELKQQLGLPTVSPENLARASELINQAQDQLNMALNELLPAGMLDELTKRQRELAANIGRAASRIGEPRNTPDEDKNPSESVPSQHKQSLEKAKQSAAEAAAKLASADIKQAINAMKDAENALKEASKSQPSGQSVQSTGQENREGDQPRSSSGNQAGQNKPSQNSNPSMVSAGESVKAGDTQNAKLQSGVVPGQNEKLPTVQELENEQSEIRELAEQYLNSVEPSLNRSLAKAAQSLNSASAIIGALSATASGIPQSARQPLQKANSELMNATSSASAQKPAAARNHAQNAQESLAQASAAIALATSGQRNQPLAADQQQGQNQSGQNQGQSNSNAQSGTQNAGQGQDGSISGMGSSQQRAAGQMGRSQGTSGNWYGPGGDKGQRIFAEGASKFIGLPKRDRDAILQSQSEKYPPDYASFIEQYMKNLSDEITPKK